MAELSLLVALDWEPGSRQCDGAAGVLLFEDSSWVSGVVTALCFHQALKANCKFSAAIRDICICAHCHHDEALCEMLWELGVGAAMISFTLSRSARHKKMIFLLC